jgi:hypothetical protein
MACSRIPTRGWPAQHNPLLDHGLALLDGGCPLLGHGWVMAGHCLVTVSHSQSRLGVWAPTDSGGGHCLVQLLTVSHGIPTVGHGWVMAGHCLVRLATVSHGWACGRPQTVVVATAGSNCSQSVTDSHCLVTAGSWLVIAWSRLATSQSRLGVWVPTYSGGGHCWVQLLTVSHGFPQLVTAGVMAGHCLVRLATVSHGLP